MTGVYSVLLILMLVGMSIANAAVRVENYLLRWRRANG
jgi:ABC-type nitrate/sulfonate/bicarbonate transport system permease component